MSKHTPGPWAAVDATLFGSRVIRWIVLETQNGFTVVDSGNADTDKSQDEANAHLISAAPEMLHLLKECLQHCFAGATPTNELLLAVEAAIAKAEGSEVSKK